MDVVSHDFVGRRGPSGVRVFMAYRLGRCGQRMLIVAICVVAYFVLYPQDLATLLAPLSSVLSLSNSVAPGMYAVVVVGVLSWTVIFVALRWMQRS